MQRIILKHKLNWWK